jgi:hypothetical protein
MHRAIQPSPQSRRIPSAEKLYLQSTLLPSPQPLATTALFSVLVLLFIYFCGKVEFVLLMESHSAQPWAGGFFHSA